MVLSFVINFANRDKIRKSPKTGNFLGLAKAEKCGADPKCSLAREGLRLKNQPAIDAPVLTRRSDTVAEGTFDGVFLAILNARYCLVAINRLRRA